MCCYVGCIVPPQNYMILQGELVLAFGIYSTFKMAKMCGVEAVIPGELHEVLDGTTLGKKVLNSHLAKTQAIFFVTLSII